MVGDDQPDSALQVAVSMWSVWHFCNQISAELAAGTGRGCVVGVMVRLEAERGFWQGGACLRAEPGSLEVGEVGVEVSERSGVGGKVELVVRVMVVILAMVDVEMGKRDRCMEKGDIKAQLGNFLGMEREVI